MIGKLQPPNAGVTYTHKHSLTTTRSGHYVRQSGNQNPQVFTVTHKGYRLLTPQETAPYQTDAPRPTGCAVRIDGRSNEAKIENNRMTHSDG